MIHASAVGVAMPIGETIEPIVTIADGDRSWTLALAFDRALLVENDCCQLVGEPRVFPSTLAALDSLSREQRIAIGLDDVRYAALAEVDALRRAIAAGQVDSAQVRKCLLDLPSVFAATPAGEWQIRRPVLKTPAELARFADRVVADFARAPDEALGRLRQLAIALGVEARPPRAAATATVALPIEVAFDDRRVHELPLIAQDDRPDLIFPPRDRYAAPTTVVDPLTALYDALMFQCQRIVHLTRTEEDEVDSASLQHVVDELSALFLSPPEISDAWEHTTTRHEKVALSYRGSNPVTDGQEPPPAVLWLDADTIATMRGDVLVTISLATSDIVREYPLNFAVVHSCDDAGRFVIVAAEPEDYGGFGIGCLDLQTGEWLDELPEHLPAVTFSTDELGVSTLYDHRREARANGVFALAFARGHRSVLLSSRNDVIAGRGICAMSTLFSEVSFAPLDAATKRSAKILLADGSLVDEAPDLDALMQERTMLRAHLPWPAAIAYVDNRWRFVLPSLHVGDVDRTYFRLGFPIDAACFSPDGRRLLVRGDELLAIDLPSGAITWRAAVPS